MSHPGSAADGSDRPGRLAGAMPGPGEWTLSRWRVTRPGAPQACAELAHALTRLGAGREDRAHAVAALWATLRRRPPASVTFRLTHEEDHRAGVLAMDDEIIATLRLPGSVPAPGTVVLPGAAEVTAVLPGAAEVTAVLPGAAEVTAALLDIIADQDVTLDHYQRELENTDRGLLALHTELAEQTEQFTRGGERQRELHATEQAAGAGAEADHCATAILAMVSPGGQMNVATAGHPPPLLREPDGAVRRLEDLGPMLGLPIDYTYTASSMTLQPGSMLLFYTDGLIERRDAIIDAGIDQLAAAFEIAPAVSIRSPTPCVRSCCATAAGRTTPACWSAA